MEHGVVREWYDEYGWGVIESRATPGGCWAHFGSVRVEGYRALTVGTDVDFAFETVRQDAFAYRATAVWPPGVHAGSSDPLSVADSGSRSPVSLPKIVPVRVFRGSELVSADPTPGMDRELAFELPLLWAGQVTTAPGVTSGWHHHDSNNSSLYIVSGIFRFEFEGRAEPLDAGPGDFVHVPAYTVHRESNPTDAPSLAVIARAGGGIPTVNVATPPAPHH